METQNQNQNQNKTESQNNNNSSFKSKQEIEEKINDLKNKFDNFEKDKHKKELEEKDKKIKELEDKIKISTIDKTTSNFSVEEELRKFSANEGFIDYLKEKGNLEDYYNKYKNKIKENKFFKSNKKEVI